MNNKRKSVTQNKFTSLILQFNIISSRFEFFIALIQYHEFDLLKHMLLQNAYYYLSSLRLGSILASIYNFLHIVSFIPIDKSHNSKNQNGDDKLHHISISAKDNISYIKAKLKRHRISMVSSFKLSIVECIFKYFKETFVFY